MLLDSEAEPRQHRGRLGGVDLVASWRRDGGPADRDRRDRRQLAGAHVDLSWSTWPPPNPAISAAARSSASGGSVSLRPFSLSADASVRTPSRMEVALIVGPSQWPPRADVAGGLVDGGARPTDHPAKLTARSPAQTTMSSPGAAGRCRPGSSSPRHVHVGPSPGRCGCRCPGHRRSDRGRSRAAAGRAHGPRSW